MRLFELGKGKAISSSKEFPILYHLCDYVGFSYAMENDALRTHAYNYVSTTWNENMNAVAAKPFSLFKLVLDGSLIDDYGAFHYDDYAIEIGDNGKRGKRVSHAEDEIGIDTREIKPLSRYHKGTVLMFNLFSEAGLQWLLYRNKGHGSGFMRIETAATQQAIDTIHYHLFDLRKPLWKEKVGRNLSKEELRFLNEVHKIKDLPFTKALEEITKQFPMVDHWEKPLDYETSVRRHMAPKAVALLNGYMADKKVHDIDVRVVRSIIQRIIEMLGLGHNAETVIMQTIEESGLLHPTTPPVVWGSIITSAMDGNVDDTLEMIRWFAERDQHRRTSWDARTDDDLIWKYSTHAGTEFGRRGER